MALQTITNAIQRGVHSSIEKQNNDHKERGRVDTLIKRAEENEKKRAKWAITISSYQQELEQLQQKKEEMENSLVLQRKVGVSGLICSAINSVCTGCK
jgi:hypothetical protein